MADAVADPVDLKMILSVTANFLTHSGVWHVVLSQSVLTARGLCHRAKKH